MQSLQKPNVVFTWGPEHKREFDDIKKLQSSWSILQFYNPQLLIQISHNASKKGLEQQYAENGYQSLMYHTQSQSRYSPIEWEAIAIQFACEIFH